MHKAQHYEYKLPEGYVWTPELRLKFDALVDEACLSEVEAQRFLDLHVEMMEEYASKFEAELGSVV